MCILYSMDEDRLLYNPPRYDGKGMMTTVNYIWILLGVHYQVNSTATINSNAAINVSSLVTISQQHCSYNVNVYSLVTLSGQQHCSYKCSSLATLSGQQHCSYKWILLGDSIISKALLLSMFPLWCTEL
jgi:hypothetical protein